MFDIYDLTTIFDDDLSFRAIVVENDCQQLIQAWNKYESHSHSDFDGILENFKVLAQSVQEKSNLESTLSFLPAKHIPTYSHFNFQVLLLHIFLAFWYNYNSTKYHQLHSQHLYWFTLISYINHMYKIDDTCVLLELVSIWEKYIL